MFSILGLLGSVGSLLSGVAPAVSSYLAAGKSAEATEFASMTTAEQAEWSASQQAWIAANRSKVQNNATRAAHFFVYAFGLPPAIHLGAVYITAAIPVLGVAIYPMAGVYAGIEKDIAESFFILAPTLPLVQALSERVRA